MQHVKRWKINLLVCCFMVGIGVAACQQTPAVLSPSSQPAQVTLPPVTEAPSSETPAPTAHIAGVSLHPPPTPIPAVIVISPSSETPTPTAHVAEVSLLPSPTPIPDVIVISPSSWPETVPIPHPGVVICEHDDSFFQCEDVFLGIHFEYPIQWGGVSVRLSENSVFSYGYGYGFSQSESQPHPYILGAGGFGHRISMAGRGRVPTDFNGFEPGSIDISITDACQSYSVSICEEIQPNVLYMEARPKATSICHALENPLSPSWGTFSRVYVAINLPEHEQVTGFIFATGLSFPSSIRQYWYSLLDSDGKTVGSCGDAEKMARFDAEVDALYASLENQTADPEIMIQYQDILHLARSIRLRQE